MDPCDELRIRYRRLKTLQLEAAEARRSEQAGKLLAQVGNLLHEKGFTVSVMEEGLKAVLDTRIVLLRADSEDEIRVGEFLGFTFSDSLKGSKRRRIVAHLHSGTLPEHAPIDVNTPDSIQAQIAYMEALLAEAPRDLQGFEVKETMSMASYREPQPESGRQLFASIEEAITHLLAVK